MFVCLCVCLSVHLLHHTSYISLYTTLYCCATHTHTHTHTCALTHVHTHTHTCALTHVHTQAHRAEDEKYSEIKAQLRKEIGELRENVLSMIATNDHLPDIEKLGRHEFILDMEEHQRLQAEEEQLIQQVTLGSSPALFDRMKMGYGEIVTNALQVHEEIELSNLAKMFLREQIKKECWSDMAVKGKVAKVSIIGSSSCPPPLCKM